MEPLIPVRFVHFAATLLACGTVWFALLLPLGTPIALQHRLRVLIWVTLTIAILSGALWLLVFASTILDTSMADAALGGGLWPVVTNTRFGQVSVVRLLVAVTLAALVVYRRLAPVHGLLALGLVALPAVTGHAGAKPGLAAYAPIAGDMVHLTAAAAWLGALPAFALTLIGSLPGAEIAKVTQRYGRVALCAVTALALSGLINAWSLLSGLRDLLDTDYGRLLALKLFLFAAMLALAAVNRLRLTPALPDAHAQRLLAGMALCETGLGVGVVLVVAILGTVPPGSHAHPGSIGIQPDSSFVHIHTNEAMADVTIDPGRIGRADVTIHLWREDMTELPADAVRLALDPPQNGARLTSEHVAVQEPSGAWRVKGVQLTRDGAWTVHVIITPRTGSMIVLDAPIVIAR